MSREKQRPVTAPHGHRPANVESPNEPLTDKATVRRAPDILGLRYRVLARAAEYRRQGDNDAACLLEWLTSGDAA